MTIPVKTALGGYDIIIERGALKKASEYFNLDRKVLVITDSGVPGEYANTVADAAKESLVLVIPEGEKSKSFENYVKILEALLGADFTRSDCVVAVGGGVVGDMAGFAAATYMRGIDFYNIPTTVLSQVDSTIGGKTAIDFGGYKNTVGAFYPPKRVLIDADTLSTLDDRQISNGLAEALKISATFDAGLFAVFENGEAKNCLEEVIKKSVSIKKKVIEADEYEAGLRRVLNFGHTLGHAIESADSGLLHGECVGIGMLYMCSVSVKKRIESALKKLDLPTGAAVDFMKIEHAVLHDKKASGNSITTVFVDEIGSYRFDCKNTDTFLREIERNWQK
ncbi:MAG: 3-dehydroquinate synthase [Clostridia bacterium]|nr:3-dehydroquinate synthase [Clostridia bacterium]